MSAARLGLIGAGLAALIALAGCKSEQATTARSVQPLSPALVGLMTEKGMTARDPILLRIYKEESKAEIWKKRQSDGRYALLKTYDICRFSGKLGPKIKEGDKQAPEGFYSVTPAQMNPRSNYYLSFNIGYPNAYDRALGRSGQHVMMHGDCLSAGCYAMTDAQIGEIYELARESFAGGQKAFQVQALPFRMTAQNMARRRDNPNIAFWRNLKQGSDNFEVTKLEPKVDACGKKYVFNASAGPLSTFEPTAACPSYKVEPGIAKAVAAKEKADNILIAQLSKQEPPAPEYVAQNGRMRRTLDQPVVEVAAATPAPAAPVAYAAADATPTGALAAAQPRAAVPASSATPVALTTPVEGATQIASASPATTKVEGGFFSKMFAAPNPPEPEVAQRTVPAPQQVASNQPPANAKTQGPKRVIPIPGQPRQVSPDQQPVMASTTPAPSDKPSGLVGWMKGVFGGGDAKQPEPATPQPASLDAPAVAPIAPKKNRSASAAPAKPANTRVASAFAPAE